MYNGIARAGQYNYYTPNEFGTDVPCTRAMAVIYFYRMYGQYGEKGSGTPFSDTLGVSGYGTELPTATLWAMANGITFGVGNDKFEPYTVCNRAMIVTFLHRIDGFAGTTGTTTPDTPAAPTTPTTPVTNTCAGNMHHFQYYDTIITDQDMHEAGLKNNVSYCGMVDRYKCKDCGYIIPTTNEDWYDSPTECIKLGENRGYDKVTEGQNTLYSGVVLEYRALKYLKELGVVMPSICTISGANWEPHHLWGAPQAGCHKYTYDYNINGRLDKVSCVLVHYDWTLDLAWENLKNALDTIIRVYNNAGYSNDQIVIAPYDIGCGGCAFHNVHCCAVDDLEY